MKKYPFLKQLDIKDCGVACLSMIIKFYKGYVPIEILREKTKTDKNGVSAYNLIKAANELGFKADGIKIEIENIDKLIFPCICYVIKNRTFTHFVVAYQIDLKKKKILIADPDSDIHWMKLNEFKSIFKNIVITLYPQHKIPKFENMSYLLVLIKKVFKNNKKIIIKLYLISLFTILLTIILSFFLKILIDKITYHPNMLLKIFMLFLFLSFIKSIFTYLRNKILIKFRKNFDYLITTDIVKNIIFLPYSYYKLRTTGEVISRYNDISKIKDFSCEVVLSLLLDCTLFLNCLIILFIISKKLTIIYFIFLILSLFISCIKEKNILKEKEELIKQNSISTSYLVEIIEGFESIKGLGTEKNILDTFKSKYNSYIIASEKYNRLVNKQNFLKETIYKTSDLVIIFIGVILVKEKFISISSLILFQSISIYLFESYKNIINLFRIYKEVKISIRRINEMIYKNLEKKINIKKIDRIDIKNLTYSFYDKPLLNNLNIKINSKEKIALIGSTGCGKSTLFKLLKGYYMTENNIYLNGIDISKVDKNTLDRIVFISQNETLFTESIYQNIVMNRKDDNLNKISNICLVDEIVSNKKLGYDFLIEENGFNISGGQKQRIVIARALISDFDILLIDEGLCEVDTKLERRILINILEHFKDKIIIFVTHRKDNIDLFDKVLNLKDGKVKEEVL